MLTKLIAVLTQNLTTKLLALLLAVVVYAHVATEAEQVAEIRAPLRVSGLPETLVLTSTPPTRAVIAARGKGKQLFKLRVEPPLVTLDLSTVHAGRVQRILAPGDVALPAGAAVFITEVVEPRLVELEIDTVIVRQVEVRVVPAGRFPKEVVLQGEGIPDPLRVKVRGPSRLLGPMTRVDVRFDPGALGSLAVRNTGGEASLEFPVSVPAGVVSDPPRVSVRFRFAPPVAPPSGT